MLARFMSAKRGANGSTPKGSKKGIAKKVTKKGNSMQTNHVSPGHAQRQDLSDEERAVLREALSRSDKPFVVATEPLSRKRKRKGQELPKEDNLFEDRLSVRYEVRPRHMWEALKQYKRFSVGMPMESIGTGQCILVNYDDTNNASMDVGEQWKAKVLEVRALDEEHVYIRVAWLNRPEDLDSGRKPYHGKNELIPTNQMDVIDALSVNGSLPVIKWEEAAEDDENSMPAEDQYFWRQTYDSVNTKTFSQLQPMCIDNAPQNPDELIIQCANPDCRRWMHVKCIAERAVERASERTTAALKTKAKGAAKVTPQKRSLQIDDDSMAVAKAQKGEFTGEVFLKAAAADGSERNEVVIVDPAGQRHAEKVRCLFCETEVE